MSNSFFSKLVPDLDCVIGTGFSLAGCATGIVCGLYNGVFLLCSTDHLKASPKAGGAVRQESTEGGHSQVPSPIGSTAQDNDEQHGVYDRLFYSSTSSFLRSAAHPEASTFSFSSTTSASSSDESHEETVFPSATQDSKPQPQQQQRRGRAWLPTRCIAGAAKLCPGSRLLRSVVRKTDRLCHNVGELKTQADGSSHQHLALVVCPSTCDHKQKLSRAQHLLFQAKDMIDRGKAVSPHDTYELVLDLYNEGIQLDVEDAETRAKLYHNRGIARLHLGHLMAALFDCFMSVETCPEAWQPYHLRARVYERIGEYTLAVQDYEACLQRGGASDKIHTMLLSLKQPCFQSDKILQMDSSLATFEQRALAPSAFRKLSRQFHPDKVPAQQKHIACVVFNYLKQAASNFW